MRSRFIERSFVCKLSEPAADAVVRIAHESRLGPRWSRVVSTGDYMGNLRASAPVPLTRKRARFSPTSAKSRRQMEAIVRWGCTSAAWSPEGWQYRVIVFSRRPRTAPYGRRSSLASRSRRAPGGCSAIGLGTPGRRDAQALARLPRRPGCGSLLRLPRKPGPKRFRDSREVSLVAAEDEY
jgi:hypothetical protein